MNNDLLPLCPEAQPMTSEQSFFAVFCIEALADELGTTGDNIYRMFTENSTILDDYIVPCYDALHTQGKEFIRPVA
ncbi:MAG: DUF3791 domain-containing protein [Planctomycetaceae bacterium]|jgi:hypothetical protein|nr:DUF3791 domain-containing protein [Planctomycetaceae bacterium]